MRKGKRREEGAVGVVNTISLSSLLYNLNMREREKERERRKIYALIRRLG